MQFSLVLASVLACASTTLAVPAMRQRQVSVCTGTYDNAQCCATDVLGVADLNCANPPDVPANVTDFINICSAIGQQAECCALPILGQALLCDKPLS